jgi:hypothetical protein
VVSLVRFTSPRPLRGEVGSLLAIRVSDYLGCQVALA